MKYPIPLINNNQGSIDWIELGCKQSKKPSQEDLSELGISEAREYGEIQLYWIPGATNPADLCTEENNNIQHYETLSFGVKLNVYFKVNICVTMNYLEGHKSPHEYPYQDSVIQSNELHEMLEEHNNASKH